MVLGTFLCIGLIGAIILLRLFAVFGHDGSLDICSSVIKVGGSARVER